MAIKKEFPPEMLMKFNRFSMEQLENHIIVFGNSTSEKKRMFADCARKILSKKLKQEEE